VHRGNNLEFDATRRGVHQAGTRAANSRVKITRSKLYHRVASTLERRKLKLDTFFSKIPTLDTNK
jgi:hypothetical protein